MNEATTESIVTYETAFLLTNGRYIIMDDAAWVVRQEDYADENDEGGTLTTHFPADSFADTNWVEAAMAIRGEIVWLDRTPYRVLEMGVDGGHFKVVVGDFPAIDLPYLVDHNAR